MLEPAQLADDIDRLVERGRRARATVQRVDDPASAPAAGFSTDVLGNQGVEITATGGDDDWSSHRSIVYDHAMVNGWKTDCLRLFRETWGVESGPYVEFGGLIERAGVLWRAIDPGLELLGRIRTQLAARGEA